MSAQQPGPARQRTIRLARVRGVPIVVSPSWLLIGLLLTFLYGPLIRDSVSGIGAVASYVAAFGFAVLFAVCILAHELGHTLVSTALGYPVRRIVLFLLGGVSEIEGEPQRARDELFISAAGPLVSVVLAAGFWGGSLLVADATLVHVLLVLLAWSNALLVLFNLLPGLPLDGGRLLRAAVWGFGARATTGTRIAGWSGRGVAVLVAVSGLLLDRTSDGFTSGLLSLVLAAYLWTGATQAIKVADLASRLPDVSVGSLLRPGVLVAADLSVAEVLERVWAGNARGAVLVDSADRPNAIVDETLIGAVPPARRPWTRVTDVARRLEPGLLIPVDIDARDLLERMQRTPAREYLVVDRDGAPAGIIATIDFARRINVRPARGSR